MLNAGISVTKVGSYLRQRGPGSLSPAKDCTGPKVLCTLPSTRTQCFGAGKSAMKVSFDSDFCLRPAIPAPFHARRFDNMPKCYCLSKLGPCCRRAATPSDAAYAPPSAVLDLISFTTRIMLELIASFLNADLQHRRRVHARRRRHLRFHLISDKAADLLLLSPFALQVCNTLGGCIVGSHLT